MEGSGELKNTEEALLQKIKTPVRSQHSLFCVSRIHVHVLIITPNPATALHLGFLF